VSRQPYSTSALDSAIMFAERSMRCDSFRKAAIDLKIRLLITLGNFKEGSQFIDSLKDSDFNYTYKKKLDHDNFVALGYQALEDSSKQLMVMRQMAIDLEKYIKHNTLSSKEFEEAYLDLYSLKGSFTKPAVINKEIDSLKHVHPDKESFFDFLKK
jgi:hypothetical protein